MLGDKDLGVTKHGFNFAIGDIVTTKVPSGCKLMVVSQELDICNAGAQRHYVVRAYLHVTRFVTEPKLEPAINLSKYNEVELIPLEKGAE